MDAISRPQLISRSTACPGSMAAHMVCSVLSINCAITSVCSGVGRKFIGIPFIQQPLLMLTH